ncbi:unnamed protein product [Didymodactylos carnosus]|uniref:Mitochondrial import inner membrane translocase subunit TIM50 n=1 Tax=Didymodactylos carnosus TaxID=1234261 RepID=A0A813QY23_9BILA|nr:unnamed protein product [Didymodactylos carnosus]CAF0773283.1 unnamed protein product [Didymodactylos carnosus]CAF3521075.1 unnamed protein product [Didymodactylos carnosus]CAF3555615.1 unnamed protein product [Didymodactylos carnosus]
MSKIKRLLILDLNGILVHRVYKKEYYKYQDLFKNEYRNGTIERPLYKGNFAIWLRPGVKEFLQWCLDHFHIGIWSSVRKENMVPLIEALLPNESDHSNLLFYWWQDMCLMEKNDDKNEKTSTSFYKCLERVWNTQSLEEKWKLNQKNGNWREQTLIVDDNKSKVRDNPEFTAIHPQSWKLFDIVESEQDGAYIKLFKKDNVLEENGALKQWLQKLLEWEGTVPQFVKNNAYVDPPIEELINGMNEYLRCNDAWNDN